MKRIALIIIVLSLATGVWAETPVSGTVDGKWTKEGSPYRVTGDLTVAKGTTLWIEPEVDVVFDGPYALTVEGKLVAGKKKQHLGIRLEIGDKMGGEPTVHFTTDLDKNPAGWGGIHLQNAGHESMLVNCEISHARGSGNGGGLQCEKASVALVNCTFSDCAANGSGGAMAIIDGSAALTNCTLINNRATGTGGGIYVTDGEASITNGTIALNAGGGIYLWHSELVITNLDLKGNSGAAITMLDKSEAVLTNCTIEDHTGAGIICRESQFVGTNTTIDCDTETAASFMDNSEAVLTNATLKGGKGLEKDESSEVVATNVDY